MPEMTATVCITAMVVIRTIAGGTVFCLIVIDERNTSLLHENALELHLGIHTLSRQTAEDILDRNASRTQTLSVILQTLLPLSARRYFEPGTICDRFLNSILNLSDTFYPLQGENGFT